MHAPALKVLIIEDEPFAQQELKRLLAQLSHPVEVVDCIDSVEDSIEWFQNQKSPDIIFMDIQLSDGLCFEIFKTVKINAPVIFTTAFDEYAIRAFKVNSIDYLLKPVELQQLENSLNKYKELKNQYSFNEQKINLDQLEEILQQARPKTLYKSRFIAKVGDQIKYIKSEDIAYFFAEDNIVFLVTENQGKYIVDYSLNELENYLEPRIFFRINRSFYVNIKSIVKVHKFFNSRLKIELKPSVEEDILISRIKVPEFLSWMES